MEEQIITSVVQHSSSINSAFISTVDHLPCDVIRSLWLVQACNVSLDHQKTKLNSLLLKLQAPNQEGVDKKEIIPEILLIKKKLRVLNDESIEESKALYNQLITHKLSLKDELQQLHTIANSSRESGMEIDHNSANNQLRAQLKEHYRAHPLVSQREALKEQSMRTKVNSIRAPSGIKLVLKIPNKKGSLSTNRVKKPAQKKDKSKKSRQQVILPQPEPMFESAPAVEEDNNVYCFCKQPSFGDMIGCDNEESCPNGDWFHYKCVGLLNRVDALKYTTGKQKWFCSDHCRSVVMGNKKESDSKKKKKRKRRMGY
ncbi:uncharacterized protein AC631_03896 [Debaryomyces fabryi]|uniref:Zinc finger PHD-type domain-containing protein n=1 Tax=Debaryomyces fabryi TaxID=58627 RepID=A0A0V1PVQ8_9ASCO|nr:uncharacterized protein AC631_03896 [Debaryomyces fabryi]KSA00331.1 hypothetical protein AC631_03896 [Debaryomyces fabryi]CUM49307.1 unnamed protein product [Debaryomyces fabryi]